MQADGSVHFPNVALQACLSAIGCVFDISLASYFYLFVRMIVAYLQWSTFRVAVLHHLVFAS